METIHFSWLLLVLIYILRGTNPDKQCSRAFCHLLAACSCSRLKSMSGQEGESFLPPLITDDSVLYTALQMDMKLMLYIIIYFRRIFSLAECVRKCQGERSTIICIS